MSRWLQSVNTLLETLDGQAEQVRDETQNALSALLTNPDANASTDDDDDEDYMDVDAGGSGADGYIDDDDDNDANEDTDDGSYFDQTFDGDLEYDEDADDGGNDPTAAAAGGVVQSAIEDAGVQFEEVNDYDDYTEEEVLASSEDDEEEIEIEIEDDDDNDDGEIGNEGDLDSTHAGQYDSGGLNNTGNLDDVDVDDDDDDGVSLPIQTSHHGGPGGEGNDADTVSDLSCSQYGEELQDNMLVAGEYSHTTFPRIDTKEEQNDVPPKTPNRQLSDKERRQGDQNHRLNLDQQGRAFHDTTEPLTGGDEGEAEAKAGAGADAGTGVSSPPFGDGAVPAGASTSAPNTGAPALHQPTTAMRARRRASGAELSARSMLDESPIPPRRSLDVDTRFLASSSSGAINASRKDSPDHGAAGADSMDVVNGHNSGDFGDGSRKSRSGHTSRAGTSGGGDNEQPPKPPTRQPSHPRSTENASAVHSTNDHGRPTDAMPANLTPATTPAKTAKGTVAAESQVRVSPMPSASKKNRKKAPVQRPKATSEDASSKKQGSPSQLPKQSQQPSNPQLQKQRQEIQHWQQKAQAMQEKYKKAQAELKQAQAKNKQAEKQLKLVEVRLETSNAEIEAQQKELQSAAERLERDRQRTQDERDDLLDEQEEELERLTTNHAQEMDQQKKKYEQQIAALQKQVNLEEAKRKQEGGDWTKELQDALDRERDALKQLYEVKGERASLQVQLKEFQTKTTSLQTKLSASTDSANLVAQREHELDEKLEATISLHAKQMKQRQAREAELEQTIFQLGAALTAAKQETASGGNAAGSALAAVSGSNGGDPDAMALAAVQAQAARLSQEVKDGRANFERLTDELETTKGSLMTETHRREALQKELEDISNERRQDESAALARQREQEEKVSWLEATVAKLQLRQETDTINSLGTRSSTANTTVSDARYQKMAAELDLSRQEVSKLSEQLVRHQGKAKATASENFALKDRLQAATARAESAEKSLITFQSPSSNNGLSGSLTTRRMYEVEGGGVGFTEPSATRRRVKGGARMRHGSNNVRSIRSALKIGSSQRGANNADCVSTTVDAIDAWTIDTGAILRQEPLARFAFIVYISILHLWSFALVIFHTAEAPHGDFGSMGSNPRNWRNHG